jgi:hypothetical protein
MSNQINVYCDESCHLENDGINVMGLGAVWCAKDKTGQMHRELRAIKERHGISKYAEIKWAKVSPSKIDMYLEFIDYFFNNDDLHFRVIIIPDKSKLDHRAFDQSHDDFYYKMYFNLIKLIWQTGYSYNVFLDYKDTHGSEKTKLLHEVLCNHHYDFNHDIINRVQLVRSHEVELIQLTDLILGAVVYANRELGESETKLSIIKRISERSGFTLKKSTLMHEMKFNILRWESNYGNR